MSDHIMYDTLPDGKINNNSTQPTCLMYYTACKVEFQPLNRSYSQLTIFNFLWNLRSKRKESFYDAQSVKTNIRQNRATAGRARDPAWRAVTMLLPPPSRWGERHEPRPRYFVTSDRWSEHRQEEGLSDWWHLVSSDTSTGTVSR